LFSYDFAPGENLILSDCGFEEIQWQNSLYADYETYSVYKVNTHGCLNIMQR